MSEERRLFRQTEVAKDLLKDIRQIVGDDDEAISDAVEGETNLFEALEKAVSAIDECDILLEGIGKKIQDLEYRKKATENRVSGLKAGIEKALAILEIDAPLRLPSMTLSLKKKPRALVITDEASIPSAYWNQKPAPAPVVDKKAITDALKDEKSVPGAELDNGGITLAIRRK